MTLNGHKKTRITPGGEKWQKKRSLYFWIQERIEQEAKFDGFCRLYSLDDAPQNIIRLNKDDGKSSPSES